MTADEIMSMTVAELLEQDPMWVYLLTRITIKEWHNGKTCWLMNGEMEADYCTLPHSRRHYGSRAHRAAAYLWKGIEGEHVHHSCKNRWCINPDHLEVVNKEEHQAKHKNA